MSFMGTDLHFFVLFLYNESKHDFVKFRQEEQDKNTFLDQHKLHKGLITSKDRLTSLLFDRVGQVPLESELLLGEVQQASTPRRCRPLHQ